MRFLLPVLFASVTACGQFHLKAYQDPALVPYLRDYQSVCFKYQTECDVSDISVTFEVINKGEVVGECRTSFDNDGEVTHSIRVDTSGWSVMNETTRHVLIYHELGHCHLGRRHDDRLGAVSPSSGVAKVSIMNSYLLSSVLFSAHEGYYEQELFRGPY